MFSKVDGSLRRRLLGLYGLLITANLLAWGWALVTFRDYPLLLGTAFLAYSFGLRHAVDADHIAAIDNVTRKLMQEGKRPIAVGFFFSLGHSSVVISLSIAIAATAAALQDRFSAFKEVGGIIGTSVSAFFLFAIATANLIILAAIYRSFQTVRHGGRLVEEDIDLLLASRGFLGRLFRRLFRLIGKSWHMYPLGLLFGMGFDTATEVGLLGISATEASKGLSVWSILIFPALFTAGMSLVDTLDSTLMLSAYDWAFVKPIRKLYYNMTITLVSVLVAVLIGGIETLGLIADKLALEGPFWEAVGSLNENFGLLGFVIIGIFAVSWLVSVAIYRWKGYDEIEAAA
ncbi:HoxN/HupN/NixA family nickel/cobalt transporter [Telmatospirillum sp.]|uniref:HoxN/HupN/NixA family nickel/cobalt transporter n=1 Tax=Telmatospirillum sp. TaxID=2079197 RepID=UPI00284BDCB2|nr:HoxN/HupN/NixA family nickel/cobalt transporter [Telmatospirillum sp.]MDR3440928.1 HoxN/HupN/NixA family nickel/cobalt transporter [Telmatospirillum sp.]